MNKAEPRWNIPLNQSKLWPTYPEAARHFPSSPFPDRPFALTNTDSIH